jgi:hypothetical protein
MTAGSPSCWQGTDGRNRSVAVMLAAAIILLALPLAAQSAGCNRARAIVDEVQAMYDQPQPDHRSILLKLRTAQQLCPTLGDAWRLAYCSAVATGDDQKARMYKDRALFNGVTDLACGAVGVADAPAPLPSYVRQKYALVIGIGKFRDPNIRPLQFAAKDASDFRKLLIDPRSGNFSPENVTLLTDEGATRAAILNALQQIFLRAGEDDLVVTFVSSHGSPSAEESGLAGIGYIVTYDTSIETPWVDGLDYQDFAKKASKIKARRKVLFLDTCFSGQASKRAGDKALFIEGLGVDEKTAKMFLSGEGSFIITSSRANERSWESDTIQNGYFTHYLLEAFRKGRETPTVKEIFDYLAAKVPDAVARDKQAAQHPQMQPATGPADVRIGVVPRASEPSP